MANIPKPLVLIILDGWGYAPPSNANAISLARKPNYDRLLAEFPNTLIHTSGRYVGLPTGQMGNSEVGHLNIGAGRIVYMDITKIDLMIENGDFEKNPCCLARWRRRAPATGGCTCSGCCRMAACIPTRTISMPYCAWPSRMVWSASSCTASWTDATLCPPTAPATSS